jgi:phage FluMu protein gp41
MARNTITLIDGITIGDTVHTEAELREYTAGDIIDACDAAEKLVPGENGPMLVASPSRVDAELLCRQIVRLGSHKGPLTLAELRRLSGRDLALLQGAASALDSGGMQAAQQRGRSSGSQAGA